MNVARQLAACCLVALALALVGPAAAPAAAVEATVTERIFADYVADRVIDGDYTASELSAALELAGSDAAFGEFASAVQETYDRDILGLATNPEPRAGPGPGPAGGTSFLPEPRGPGERDQPPWPFLALSALAAALVVMGAGTSILRRTRR